MRLLIIAGGHPIASRYPLAGIFEWEQAIALKKQGLDVTYFSIDLRSLRRQRKLGYSSGVNDGVEWHVISLPIGNVKKKLLCKIGQIAAKWLYNRVYSHREVPDLLHAHFGIVANYAISIKKQTNIPFFITEHSSGMNSVVTNKDEVQVAKAAYSYADKVFAVSEALSASIKELTGIDSEVVYNMVKTDVFSQCNPKAHKEFRITTISNLIPLKNTICLIKAFEALFKQYTLFRLEIIGDGELRDELEQYVRRCGISDAVNFHGRLNSNEILSILEISDCMAMVSKTETFGVVYVEAMAAGLPVIATRCGGPERIVNDNNGILVKVNDEEELKKAIIYLYNHKNHYHSDEIRKYAVENFSEGAIAKKLIEKYNEFLK